MEKQFDIATFDRFFEKTLQVATSTVLASAEAYAKNNKGELPDEELNKINDSVVSIAASVALKAMQVRENVVFQVQERIEKEEAKADSVE